MSALYLISLIFWLSFTRASILWRHCDNVVTKNKIKCTQNSYQPRTQGLISAHRHARDRRYEQGHKVGFLPASQVQNIKTFFLFTILMSRRYRTIFWIKTPANVLTVYNNTVYRNKILAFNLINIFKTKYQTLQWK